MTPTTWQTKALLLNPLEKIHFSIIQVPVSTTYKQQILLILMQRVQFSFFFPLLFVPFIFSPWLFNE